MWEDNIRMDLREIGWKGMDWLHLAQDMDQWQHALSPLLFNFALQYVIRKVLENQVGLELNGTHNLLVYTDDVNLLGDSINTIKENTESLLAASRDAGLEIITEKTKVYDYVSSSELRTQPEYKDS
jgi:hypothetical protein